MAIRQIKPRTPGQRGKSVIDYRQLDKVEPLKSAIVAKAKTDGRNSYGRITVRHRGGGNRNHYRLVDFKRSKLDIPSKVEYLEYDPNRTAFIARLLYNDGERRYIIAPDGVQKGTTIVASHKEVDIKPGNATLLKFIPQGSSVHNIEMKPGKGAQMARSAGSSCQLVGRVDGYAQLRMPSGEMRRVPETCMATIGVVSNGEHSNVKLGKAGRKRWMGIRPTVRGVAMNPVDHPHGGGEGRTSGGRHPCTPWAMPTKGYKTRKNKRTSNDIIRRRKKGKGA
jgi:large subunit ribosomal protein L2